MSLTAPKVKFHLKSFEVHDFFFIKIGKNKIKKVSGQNDRATYLLSVYRPHFENLVHFENGPFWKMVHFSCQNGPFSKWSIQFCPPLRESPVLRKYLLILSIFSIYQQFILRVFSYFHICIAKTNNNIRELSQDFTGSLTNNTNQWTS